MKWLATLAIAFGALPSTYAAGAGNDYMKCIATGEPAATACQFYISGLAMGLASGKHLAQEGTHYPICVPEGAMNSDQLRDVVHAFIRNNPKKRHEALPILAAYSLVEAFPCK